MKNLREYITESQIDEVSDDTNPRDWFMKLPVYVGSLTPKYNIRLARKDPNKFQIIIGNEFNNLRQNRDLVIDLSSYMDDLVRYPVENCMLKLDIGYPIYPDPADSNVVIHNTDAYEENKARGGHEFEKCARFYLWCYAQPPRWASNSHLKDGFQKRYPNIYGTDVDELLICCRYLDDYPRSGRFPNNENASYWTELQNNL